MIDTVAALTHLDGERAERAVHAVLQTLSERLSAGEARDLAERLPEPLAGWLFTAGGSEPFGYDEFVHRVAAREGVDLETAARHARAVFWALGRQVGSDEAADLAAELPQDFAPLDARRYVEAVFVTLRETIPEPEFLEVTAELPYEYASVGARPQRA